MSQAFEITPDDVANVLASNVLSRGLDAGETLEHLAAELMTDLDFAAIEDAALYGDDIEEQTDYAHDEIARQLRQAGVLKTSSGEPHRPARGSAS